jgi:predicted MFS family arabinose efflux permease
MSSPETRLEIQSTLSLSSIFGLRMLAVFMLIPIFTAYTQTLQGATPLLMGIAMGIYGLTQAIFQIPLGTWSDKFGRKPIAIIGLLIFALGSLMGAFAHSITIMILARALQGVGAIGSTLMALLADLTSEKNRTKAMAAVGISMGLFSALAIGVGPLIASHFGLSGVFFTSTLLTGGSLLILCFLVPSSPSIHSTYLPKSFKELIQTAIKTPSLLKLDLGIFLLHTIFTATFYACPLILKPLLADTGTFYLLILGGSFIFLFPLISQSEKKQKTSLAFSASIALLLISQIILIFFSASFYIIAFSLFLFFIGFNFLESILPSLISKSATPATKGTAMGIYSCSQFLGIFIGGTLAGTIFSWGGVQSIFIFTSILSFIWLLISIKHKKS